MLQKVPFICREMMKKMTGKFFLFLKLDKNKCPKMKYENNLCRKYVFSCIIEFYGVVAKKIILVLLR